MTDDAVPILEANDLTKWYDASEGFLDSLLGRTAWVKAVQDVDLELYEGETLGVVGESGCGKTTLGRCLIRLIEPTDGTVTYRRELDEAQVDAYGPDEVVHEGGIPYREVDVTGLSSGGLRDLRKDLQYIFQDPFSSLNPRLTVGDIIGEPLDIHGIASGDERTSRIYELLETVGLNASHSHRYPHEFSGGQRQRIGIARALAVDPEIIICDEPVSALDVSVQAQILNLLEDLQAEFGLSYIFIAHDLSVVEHISDRIAVMYLGEFAEIGATEEVFEPPHHPYAEALLSAIPEPDPLWDGEQIFLTGNVPSPLNPPSGCRFHTRCPRIIQPEEHEFDQAVWRSVMDMKLRLQGATELESMTAVEEVDEGETLDPTEASQEKLDELVRQEFSLPDDLGPDLEDVFADIVDRLYHDDFEGARQVFVDNGLASPCEEIRPDLYDVGGTHDIACLLYTDEYSRSRHPVPTDQTHDRSLADD